MAIGLRDITDWAQDNWKLLAGIGAVAWAWKNRDKIKERFKRDEP